MDSGGELGWLVEVESGGEEGSIVQQPDKVLDGLFSLVLIGLLLQLSDNWVVAVDFHGLLGDHVGSHGGISEGLSLHDSFHVGGPSVFSGNENAWGFLQSLSNDDLFDLLSKDFLDEFAEWLEGSLLLLEGLLLFLGLVEVKTLLGAVLELLSVELLELLDDVLIDGVDHVEDFVTLLLEGLNEGGGSDGGSGLSSDEEDVLLSFLHSGDVLLEGGLFVTGLGGVVSEELGEFVSVGGVLVDSELEVLSELLVELLEVFGVLGDFADEIDDLLDDVLLDDLEDLVVLEELSGDVQGEIFGINDSLDETHPFGDELFAVVHDEDSSDVELDVVLLLLGLEHIEGGSLWDEEDGLELELSLDGEVLDGEVLFPVVGE